MWLIWLFIAIAFSIAEIVYSKPFLLWFVVGAFTSLITSLMTPNMIIQLVVFILISFSLLIILAKRFKRIFFDKDLPPTNINVLMGQKAIVTKSIGQNVHELGQVKLDGEIWSATTLEGSYIEKGSIVIVEEIRGLRLIVSQSDDREIAAHSPIQ